jgi:hypothetical protein
MNLEVNISKTSRRRTIMCDLLPKLIFAYFTRLLPLFFLIRIEEYNTLTGE